MSQKIEVFHVNEVLNKNAKEYIPTKRRNKKDEESTIQKIQYIEGDDDDDEEEEKDIQEKIDKIEKDMIEEEAIEELGDDLSDDEDKWFPMIRFRFQKAVEGIFHAFPNDL